MIMMMNNKRNELTEFKLKNPTEYKDNIKKIYDLDNNKVNIENCIYNNGDFAKTANIKTNPELNITKNYLIKFLKIYYKKVKPLYKTIII